MISKDKLAKFYQYDNKLRIFILEYLAIIFIACISLLALAVRYHMFPYESVDMTHFIQDWHKRFGENGFSLFKTWFSNYSAPYLYIIYLLASLNIPSLIGAKAVSTICDFSMALFAAKIILSLTKNRLRAIVCYTSIILAPSVMLNSAAWGQCDSIFTMFIVISIYYLIEKKYLKAIIFYALSFCFKLQSVFILPVYFILSIQGVFPLFYLLIIPLSHIFVHLPLLFVNEKPYRVFLLWSYVIQSRMGKYTLLENAPTFWTFMPNITILQKSAAAWALGFVGLATFVGIMRRVVKNNILIACTFFSIFTPFVLPRMHERYFFVADVLTIIYACFLQKRFYVPILTVFASTMAYMPFLFGSHIVPFNIQALMLAVATGIVACDLWKKAKENC